MPFCRITGGSRALPKPNYFPLLPPISPADARRFCRITGKAIGLPGHHYIPVLVGLGVHREHCHITQKSEGGNDHHLFLGLQPRRHAVRPDYRYVFPVLDEQSELLGLLDSKAPVGGEEARKYVYTVDERRTSLVFPSRLEAAVRDGDVRDVMLARDADHLLLTLRKGKNVSLDVRDLAALEEDLWEGEGPGEVAYQRDEDERRRRQKREAGLADRKRIFEDKENRAAQEERRRHSAKVMKVKMQAERAEKRRKAKQSGPRKWDRFEMEEVRADAPLFHELQELAKPLVGAFDAEAFAKEAPIQGAATVTVLPTPIDVPAVVVDLETSSPGIVQQPALLEEVGGFPTLHAVAPFAPLTAEPSAEMQKAAQLVDPGALPRQGEVKAILMEDRELLNELPRLEEISELVNALDKGQGQTVEVGGRVHALRLDIAAAQRLLVGQSVDTPSGRVFVPGQTVETASGPVFMPGLTVHTPDGPLLIPGQAVEIPAPAAATAAEGEAPAPTTPGQQVFVAGQTLHTRDGPKFVQGQMLYTADGEGRFAPGQTVLTPEGPRFVPGQVVTDEAGVASFIVGQTVNTPTGPRFVPGQTLTTPSGEAFFVPGQSVEVEQDGDREWEFVPGQSAKGDNGELRFIPGQTVVTPEGPRFVAGQTAVDASGAAQFVPGVTVKDDKGEARFVPGTTLETADGVKFIEGQVIKTEKGLKFSPGAFVLAEDGVTVLEFTPAASLGDVVFRDGLPDPSAASALQTREEVLGHMVQTSHGVEFFPGRANGLPSGKVIQGKLVKSASGAVQFVPGMEIDGAFVPGQVVVTEMGEQFVPGQVVDTKEGPKFVPGQVVETQAGPKFLPGQTVLTADGPRFVPGQIIETKAGPTFIPGQVICTEEEGSRFVPGQIVETREGPRFVPGRVIETGDRVTFVPGQIVETADGLRFVAPDLQDTEEGGFEFSLQGFEVTPEELRLMRPHLSAASAAPTTAGQMSIDSRMLRQLSHAGMGVGKQVAAELPGVDVASLPTLALAEQLGLEGVAAVKMGQVLEAVLKLSYGLLDEQGHIRRKMSVTIERGLTVPDEALTQEEEALKNMLAEAIVTACITMDEGEEDVLRAVCNFFNSILESVRDKDGVVEALHGFVTFPGRVGLLCRETICQLGQGLGRADLLRSLLWGGEDVVDRLGRALEQDQLGQAFLHLAEAEPELLEVVLRRVTEAVRAAAAESAGGQSLESDQDAAEVLQRCIVAVVREASELRLQEMLDNDELAIRELLVQAINLARALGLQEVVQGLLQVLSDPSATRVLAGDRVTLDILQRLTVMRQLAERRPKFNSALGKLVSDPETARNDPRLRELVRQSAALMVVPEDQCLPELQSSADIPTALFHNTLAMEEYLRRRGAGVKGALLIVKHGFQTVIPKEAARDVLTGQIPYTLVDQKGIRHFAPMHVFSALRLSQPLANRYSMYHFNPRRGSLASAPSGASASIPEQDDTPPSTLPSTCMRCVHGDHRHHSTFTEVADVLTAREDVVGDRLTLKKGDLVEVLDTSGDTKRPRLEYHADPDLDLGLGADAASLLDNSSARHKMSVRPKRRHADPRARSPGQDARWLVRLVSDPSQSGWVPAAALERRPSTCWPSPPSADQRHADDGRCQDAKFRREAVVRELVETEEEFGRDMRHVVDRYMVPVDAPSVPRVVRDNKTLVFGNLKAISEFHNTVLIEGIKYYADEPRMIGKTFLRLERDFDKHVTYCRDEPQAQEFLQDTPEARDFFEELSQKLGDDKNLSEHLKLPIQRINDYQLLLKELVRYSSRLGEDTADLSRALELMLGVPHRANDIKFISNIEGFHGNIYKLGRLLRHDWFTVTYREGKSKERYLFLFKARILVCKVRRISEDRSVFVLKDIIRLPELEVKDIPDNGRAFQLQHQDGDVRPYPLLITAHNDTAKDAWLKEIRQYAADVLALAEHAADDLLLKEEDAVSTSTTAEPGPGRTAKQKVIVHKVHVQEPKTPEPVVEEPVTPAPGLKRKEEPLAEASKKAKVEDVTDQHPADEDAGEDVFEDARDDVPNGDNMSDIRRTSSIRRAGSSRVEVEESYSVSRSSRSSRHELYSESSSGAAGAMSSIRSSSRLESSSSRYSSGDIGDVSSSIRGGSAAITESSASSYLRGGRSSITESTESSVRAGGLTESSRTSIRELRSSTDGSSTQQAITSGKRRPSFAKTIEGQHCEPGETATFECSLSGEEAATVTWLKDNKPLSDRLMDRVSKSSVDNNFKLEILNLAEADTGMYTAHATSAEGSSTCTAHLLVQKLTDEERKQRAEANHPVFLVKLKDTELLENTYLRFMVKVKGNPNPTVRFYKDDSRILSSNDRLKVNSEQSDAGYYELVIPEVKPEDAGKYSCVAINSYGEERCDAQLSVVDDKDVFAGLDENEEVKEGQAPTFHWTRNGQAFDPEERFKVLLTDEDDSLALVFQHVKPEDAGLYTCVAQTSSGKISCSAELTVQGGVNALAKDPEKPKITVETKTQEVGIGGSAMLELKVEGWPKPEIAWSKDGQDVKAGGRVRFLYEDEESMSMIIKGVTPEDAGTYTVTAWNDLGEDFAEVSLNVKAPPKFKTKITDQACMMDDTLRVTVEVDGTPAPDLTWYKDGKEITKTDERFHIVKESDEKFVLVIEKMVLEDSGSYSVVARNEVSQTSEFYKVAVQSPPFFTQKIAPRKIEVREGDFTTFTVKVDGDPKPRVRWFKDGTELLNDDRHVKIEADRDGETHSLTIRGITRDDMGKYTCELDNRNGKCSDSTSMHVHCAPLVKQKLRDIVSKEGDLSVVFDVTVEAFPEPQVTWYHDEVEVTERKTLITRTVDEQHLYLKTYKLTMKEVQVDQAGTYTLKATNTHGETDSSSTFKVLYVPKITKKLEDVTLDEGLTLKLDIEANAVPVPDVTWYKDGQKLSAEANANIKISRDRNRQESYSMTLDLCKYHDSGEYEARVSNDQGTTSTKCKVVVNEKTEDEDEELNKKVKRIEEDEEEEEVEQVETKLKPQKDAEGEDLKEKKLKPRKAVDVEVEEEAKAKTVPEAEAVAGKPKKAAEAVKVDKVESDGGLAGATAAPEEQDLSAGRKRPQKASEATREEAVEVNPDEADAGGRKPGQRDVAEERGGPQSAELAAKPVVTKHNMQDDQLFESLAKVYEVHCIGEPKPVAKWYHDGEELQAGDGLKITEEGELYKLEVPYTVIPKDEGVYKIHLENRLGEQAIECNLKLIPVEQLRKPILKVGLKDTTAKKGEQAVLKAVITGDPVPDIKWWKDGEPVLPDKDPNVIVNCDSKFIQHDLKECTYTVTIPSARHRDTGQYSLKATNKFGSVESSALLNVLLKPEIEGLKDKTGIPTTITDFVCTIKANPAPDVKWLKDDKPVVADDHFEMLEDRENEKYTLRVNDTATDDHGVYTVIAKNSQGEATKSAQLSLHTEKPSFLKDLVDRIIKDSSPVEFKVRVNGDPKPKITWLKDDVEVITDDRVTVETSIEGQVTSVLAISHVWKEDVALYTCVATNMVGEARTSAQLNMDQAPPMVTIPLEKCIEVDEGEPLEIKGKIDGSPVPAAKWFKDSVEISPDDPHVKLTLLPDGTVKLNIDKAMHNDGGAYKVVAVNKNGEMGSLCAVAVKPKQRAPEFTKPLEAVSVQAGQPLKLEALVTAFPVPEVKWFKDGHAIRPSKEVNFVNDPVGHIGLIIDSARPEDAGEYTVKVVNKLGAIEAKAPVEVQERERRPMFHAQLLPQKVVEGFPVRMEVKVVGHPPPVLAWTCNGKEIKPDGKNVKLLSQPDGTHVLVIEKVGPEHAGEYTVTATNDQGSVSSSAPLEVQGKTRDGEPDAAPAFQRPPRDTTADEGGPLSLSATFLGNPIPDVAWLKDGEPLAPSDRVQITCDGKKVGLEVSPCTLADVGTYTCRLSNPHGTAEAAAQGNVRKVFTPATFLQKFTDMQQMPGLDAKLMARIGGNPKPTVNWFFNGKPIAETDKYHMKRDDDHICLYVKDCTPKDNGTYTCKISNSAGKDMCNADLEIVDKIEKKQKMEAPSFLKKIGDCEVVTGMSAKFTACVNGFPEPEYEWFRNGKRMEPGDRFIMESGGSGLLRLIIKDVDQADVGTYRLRIFNPHGEASCEAELRYDSLDSTGKRPIGDQYQDFKKVKTSGVPLPLPNAPIISRMTDRRLTLSWRPSIPIGPRTPVTYQVEMCELPDGGWFTVRTGIRSCACDIANLEPFRNYKFRIRVENKYGISDPSPYAVTHRDKLEPPPPRFYPYLEPGIDFRPETSPYFPKDFDIEKPPHDGYAQAPRFLRQEHDTQYGVKNHNCNLMWFVYGYPKPKMTYYFNDVEIESGGRFDQSYTRNGQATLFINRMLERDVGVYEAVATNEHGEARQRVRLEIAEYPVFIKRPEEVTVMMRKGTRLEARVIGVPYPDIKWFKDWQPIYSSERVKISFVEPDTCHLHISDAINRDEGLYSITASNVAGSVSTSVMVHIEEDERRYWDLTYQRPKPVRSHKEVPLAEHYDLGDELGRGTQGVTYHAVERSTGRNFAAKVMHGRNELRKFMENELEMMSLLHHRRLIRLHDAYETHDSFTLVTDLAGGGELLDSLTSRPFYTEWEIAGYIRQLLEGLEHMHFLNVAHLGLTPGDLLISHPGGEDLKICDFGLARRISSAALAPLLYGMPEFVAPEVMRGDGVSLSADMWSVGIITYLLLSGRSLFRGDHDRETLTKIKEGKWAFDEDLFANYSAEARDFITKLLVYVPGGRLNVEQALQHPWLSLPKPHDPYRMSSDALKNYYNLYKDWYSNASCRKWYRRRPLEGAFTHPSKMVYPPYERYTPEPTPEREPYKPRNWEEEIHTGGTDLNYEIGLIKSESHYQNGPDTYLLQLRDVDFPVRLREYLKVAANRGPGYSRIVTDQSHLDWRAPVIRERRRFTDVMDEEIDDERKARISKYGSGDVYSLRRLRHELGTRLDGHAEAEAIMQTRHEEADGQLPFFREKPQTVPIVANEDVEITCLAVGDPKPLVQWYKCDMVVQETVRISFREDEEGRSVLRLGPAHNMDIGIYKVVARNKGGQTVARFRVVLAGVPDSPDSPDVADVSDDEVFLRWKQPKDDGNTAVLCYALQYKEVDGDQWLDVARNIDHEFFVVKNLQQMSRYYFRLAAKNRVGWSDYGIPIKVKTKPEGVPKVQITRAMAHLQSITESGAEVNEMEAAPKLDYTVENNPINWIPEIDVSEKYHFISEISRGRFSVVVKGVEKSNDHIVAGKLLELRPEREVAVNREFEALRRLRHERIAQLLEAYRAPGSEVAVLIQEKLQGADILTYFSSRHEYNEQMVCNVVTQVLDGLQYLHWRGICHLDLQPDNIVMASVRSLQVKLVDLGSAQTVSKLGTLVDRVGHIEYSSPEMLNDEPVFPQSDMWSLGVVTYVLLSGVSPFRGENNEETRQNILFVRYRFEHLFKELTQEATRFLMLIFKRTPSKRPTIEECHEHRWLLPTEFMLKKRERASFLGMRLKDFCEEYHTMRARQAINADSLVGSMSSGDSSRRLTLSRSDSIVEELSQAFQNGAVV